MGSLGGTAAVTVFTTGGMIGLALDRVPLRGPRHLAVRNVDDPDGHVIELTTYGIWWRSAGAARRERIR